ncbi:MAG TPA: sulfotransferase [Polyangia bacterium]
MHALRFFRGVSRGRADRKHQTEWLPRDLARYAGNRLLAPLDRVLQRRLGRPDLPIGFIVCVPRSGGTVLYQLLARHLDVAYINNRMARYWAAPVIGAWLHGQQARASIALQSDYGRSAGPAGPHEFAWFWHHHGGFEESDELSETELAAIDGDAVRTALQGIAGLARRPLLVKSIDYVNYQIAWVKRQIPTAKFIWIERDVARVLPSIVRARETENRDPQAWWSTRPRDFRIWRNRSVAAQAQHQIEDVRAAIARGLAAIPAGDSLRVTHEELVAAPAEVVARAAALLETSIVDAEALANLRLGA